MGRESHPCNQPLLCIFHRPTDAPLKEDAHPTWVSPGLDWPPHWPPRLLTWVLSDQKRLSPTEHPRSFPRTTSICKKPVPKGKRKEIKYCWRKFLPSFVTRLSCKQTPARTWKAIALRTLARALVTISHFTAHRWAATHSSSLHHLPAPPVDFFFFNLCN